MRYFAIKIKGEIFVMNDHVELGGLVDMEIEPQVLGEVCDDNEFGDNCSTGCQFYRLGTCRAEVIKDSFGMRWHVRPGRDFS